MYTAPNGMKFNSYWDLMNYCRKQLRKELAEIVNKSKGICPLCGSNVLKARSAKYISAANALKLLLWRLQAMKARVKTRRDIEYQLQRKEIERINKLWLFSLHQCFEFGNVRLRKIYQEICDISEKAYNMPEIWYYIDEILIGDYSMDFFEPENLQEREKTVKQIHKENGKKWRDY